MNHIITLDELESFCDEPGESGHILEGYKVGLASTSVMITSTSPGGGPPMHTHNTEEVHVLPECRMTYIMDNRVFHVDGPCVVKIPAETSHTFVNAGDQPVRIVAFWPARGFWDNYQELGPNPLGAPLDQPAST